MSAVFLELGILVFLLLINSVFAMCAMALVRQSARRSSRSTVDPRPACSSALPAERPLGHQARSQAPAPPIKRSVRRWLATARGSMHSQNVRCAQQSLMHLKRRTSTASVADPPKQGLSATTHRQWPCRRELIVEHRGQAARRTVLCASTISPLHSKQARTKKRNSGRIKAVRPSAS